MLYGQKFNTHNTTTIYTNRMVMDLHPAVMASVALCFKTIAQKLENSDLEKTTS